jgi:hypothetical protein
VIGQDLQSAQDLTFRSHQDEKCILGGVRNLERRNRNDRHPIRSFGRLWTRGTPWVGPLAKGDHPEKCPVGQHCHRAFGGGPIGLGIPYALDDVAGGAGDGDLTTGVIQDPEPITEPSKRRGAIGEASPAREVVEEEPPRLGTGLYPGRRSRKTRDRIRSSYRPACTVECDEVTGAREDVHDTVRLDGDTPNRGQFPGAGRLPQSAIFAQRPLGGLRRGAQRRAAKDGGSQPGSEGVRETHLP